QLRNSFRWDSEARNGLVLFLRNCGWTVVQCETEADVTIATDTVQGDIVISADSDLFVYQHIKVVWRPLPGNGFLEYQKSAVISALGFETAEQLAALGVVSTNDYNHSVYGLGCETNYKIIKEIDSKGSDKQVKDVPALVKEYLADERVVIKNKGGNTFDTSIDVFVHLKQTLITHGQHDNPDVTRLETRLEDIKERFKDACGKFAERKQTQLTSRQAAKSISKKPATKPKKPPTPIESMNKKQLREALGWEHPMVTLNIGTLQANIRAALKTEREVSCRMIVRLREAVNEANKIKRRAQRLIGRYVEKMASGCLEPVDQTYLDGLCRRVQLEDADDGQDGSQNHTDDNIDDGSDSSNTQQQFLAAFLRHLYSGNPPTTRGIGPVVSGFIVRLQQLNLYTPPRSTSAILQRAPFTPSDLLRSVSSQLAAELKRLYCNGTIVLQKQLVDWQDKGRPEVDGCDLKICNDLTVVENFLRFNNMTGNRRKIAPLSTPVDHFVSFSERELVALCWKDDLLKTQILELARPTFPTCSAMDDVIRLWMPDQEPGLLIKNLIADVAPTGLTVRRRGKLGYRGAIINMSIQDTRNHLSEIHYPNFDPRNYDRKGYALSGSFSTNGFTLQLSAFKLRELQAVRYRRLPDNILPPRLTSTVGGTDYYLQEIRNVVKTKDDVSKLWPHCAPEKIKILCLDLGQTYVVAGSAFLPDADPVAHGITPASSISTAATGTNTAASSVDPLYPRTYYNMSVNQKAVCQPAFKFRKWSEEQKRAVPAGATQSIQEIESDLPPLRGPDASIEQYVQQLEMVERHLSNFYNGSNRLYQRGSIGARRDEKNMAVIGVGLGQFSSCSRLSSLHTSFQRFFVPLARSLGYIVIGVNEFYPSKKCPRCHVFVAQRTIRRLFCEECGTPFHRDELAAHNMVNAVQGHLLHQKRPLYLQPVDKDGHYPWIETKTTRGSTDKDSQALEGTSSSYSRIDNGTLSGVQGSSHKESRRKASDEEEEEEQTMAVRQRCRRPRK
ncbi:hypothetical protein BGZ98_001851, partial [Dissophora globulifera]